MQALEIVNNKLNVSLPIEEGAYIAIHKKVKM